MSATASRTGAGRKAAVPDSIVSDDAKNDRLRKKRTVSTEAKSRPFLNQRLRDSQSYAQFATAAGVDLFNGEPIETFNAVGKVDERTLRMRAQELREEIFRASRKNRKK